MLAPTLFWPCLFISMWCQATSSHNHAGGGSSTGAPYMLHVSHLAAACLQQAPQTLTN